MATARRFEIGDHVGWNSEAGRVSGTIIAVHEEDFDYHGHRHHASHADPQYEIQSDRTEHIAAHRGAALRKVRRAAGKPRPDLAHPKPGTRRRQP